MKREMECLHQLPVSECQPHWIEFCQVTGNTIKNRALKWSLGDDTGASSETLCRFILGISPDGYRNSEPADAADRGRCVRLLKLIPEWISRLDELKQLDENRTISINGAPAVPRSQTKYSWTYQIPLIIKEGGFRL